MILLCINLKKDTWDHEDKHLFFNKILNCPILVNYKFTIVPQFLLISDYPKK